MLNRKGQEEAPFELLVAVITMGFVLLIGLVAMGELEKQKCISLTEANLEDFKTRVEIVVNQKTPQVISFRSQCYNSSDEIIKIQVYNAPRICADYCASGGTLCSLLSYSNSKAGVYFKKCLNINPDTVFISEDAATMGIGSACQSLYETENKVLTDFKENIPRGVYKLVNKTSGSFPTICAYCNRGSGTC